MPIKYVHQRCSPKMLTKGAHQGCLPKIPTKDAHQRWLPKMFIKDVHQRCLPKDVYQIFPPKMPTKDFYQRCLPKMSTKDAYQRCLPKMPTKDAYQRRLIKMPNKKPSKVLWNRKFSLQTMKVSIKYQSWQMTVNAGLENNRNIRNLVLQKNFEAIMDWTCKHWQSFRENGTKKDIYTSHHRKDLFHTLQILSQFVW